MFSVKVIWVCFWSGWLLQQTLKSLIRTRFLKVHINRESYRDVFRRYHFKFLKAVFRKFFLVHSWILLTHMVLETIANDCERLFSSFLVKVFKKIYGYLNLIGTPKIWQNNCPFYIHLSDQKPKSRKTGKTLLWNIFFLTWSVYFKATSRAIFLEP